MMRFAICAGVVAAILAGCSPKFDWREIRAPDAGFVVLLPDKPQTVTREMAFDGRTIRMTIVSTGVGPSLFAAGVAQLPPEAVAPEKLGTTLSWFRDGLVRNVSGSAVRVEPVALSPAAAAGHAVRGGQAVEAKGRVGRDGRAGKLAARFHVVDDRLYQLVAIGADGEIPDDALETFFSSFRLVR